MEGISFVRDGATLRLETNGKADVSVVEDVHSVLVKEVSDGDMVSILPYGGENADSAFLQLMCSAYKGLHQKGIDFQLGEVLLGRAALLGLDRCIECLRPEHREPGATCPLFGMDKAIEDYSG